MNVLIVESAAKAKTINKYLGSGYKVIASFGHVSDLPPKDGSVEPENDFAMKWEEDGKAAGVGLDIVEPAGVAGRGLVGRAAAWRE